ncbi:hypothetical protein IAQ61_000081 [Plenodomus lingam]|uniref:uncharacterized protein n=1 Tax=Leptosphaeria maculans TaxID=5022 RepID=UPI00331BAB13|nr:hypothetical protein IAQ61_000081 [Plenodomus lingam]
MLEHDSQSHNKYHHAIKAPIPVDTRNNAQITSPNKLAPPHSNNPKRTSQPMPSQSPPNDDDDHLKQTKPVVSI